jgi:LysR family nitrogen assimilation transcriptional regulator
VREGQRLIFQLVDEIVGSGVWLGAERLKKTQETPAEELLEET